MSQFLDEPARAGFARAIAAVEGTSAVEVVVAVRHDSGAYHHANAMVGALVAFAALAVMLFVPHEFSLAAILTNPFLFGVGAAWLVERVPQPKRWLTPRRVRRAHVQRAARGLFVEHGVHATSRRSGLLVYISWLEREVALIPDVGLAHALPARVLVRAEAVLSRAMPRGAAVADGVQALAPELASSMPHHAGDVNELPDAIDSDMEAS